MKVTHLERLAALLATRDHTPQLRHVRFFGGKRGYYLDDEFIGKNRNEAFLAIVDRIQERMQWELRDMPQSKVSTRRGRG